MKNALSERSGFLAAHWSLHREFADVGAGDK